MRYRIVIEVDADDKIPRAAINNLADNMKNEAVTVWCNPVYVATEVVSEKQLTILVERW